jgi:hypothetical protein
MSFTEALKAITFLVSATLTLCLILLTFLIILGATLNYLEYNTLKQVGYETTYVNLQCFAKQQDKWLDCSVVAKNYQNVSIKEVK